METLGSPSSRAEGLCLTKVLGSHGLFKGEPCHVGQMPALGPGREALRKGRKGGAHGAGEPREAGQARPRELWAQGCRGGHVPPPPLERLRRTAPSRCFPPSPPPRAQCRRESPGSSSPRGLLASLQSSGHCSKARGVAPGAAGAVISAPEEGATDTSLGGDGQPG